MSIRLIYLITLLFALSSCVEIIDDLLVNEDGSGTFKYNVNLSSSRVKINSILALDTLDGKKVPSLDEIRNKIDNIVSELETKNGISNVLFTANYDDYIFKLQCDFESLELLQNAIKEIVILENNGKSVPELEEQWLEYDSEKLVRSIPKITVQKSKETNKEEIELLKNGKYTSITRFNVEVDHSTNENSLISKNKKAVMVQTDPYSLTENPNLLDNTIYLSN